MFYDSTETSSVSASDCDHKFDNHNIDDESDNDSSNNGSSDDDGDAGSNASYGENLRVRGLLFFLNGLVSDYE